MTSKVAKICGFSPTQRPLHCCLAEPEPLPQGTSRVDLPGNDRNIKAWVLVCHALK